MELVVFSGIQAAGKSTFYQQRFATTHVRLSLDVLGTRNREDILLHACLAAQQRFVIDNTNPTAVQRARYSGLARSAGFRAILYFFEVDLDEALRRNSGRSESQRIPEVGVRGTFAKQERPTPAEPFDEIYLVSLAADGNWNIKDIRHEI